MHTINSGPCCCCCCAQFPWVLNMEPYTVSGMARQDCSVEGGEGRGDGTSGGSPRKKVTISENYELVGVVVHSGQAHAGHYYSFIKDRRWEAERRLGTKRNVHVETAI